MHESNPNGARPEAASQASQPQGQRSCWNAQLTGKGTAPHLRRHDPPRFPAGRHLGAIGLSLPIWWRPRPAARSTAVTTNRSVIMIFNLGAPSQLDMLGHEARRPGRDSRAVQADRDRRRRASRSPRSFRAWPSMADKFSLVRSCYHTAAAVHDTGPPDDADRPAVHRRHRHAARRLRGRVSARPPHRHAGPRAAARADGPHRRQLAARAGRRLPGQGVRSVRADGRSLAAEFQGARPVAAGRDRRGPARSPPQAADDRRRHGQATSRPATTRSCSTATSSRPSA